MMITISAVLLDPPLLLDVVVPDAADVLVPDTGTAVAPLRGS